MIWIIELLLIHRLMLQRKMDSWKSHLMLGLTVQAIFAGIMIYLFEWFNYFNSNFIFQILIISFVSPLVVDLDHKQSKLREGMTFLGLMIGLVGVVGYYFGLNFIILMVYGLIISSSAYLLFFITKHRGFMHSLPFCVIYGVILYLLTKNIQIMTLGFIGCYTHLVGDKIFFKMR